MYGSFEEGTETKIRYNDKEVTLNRLKQARRDGAGTKYPRMTAVF